ncbi:MAG: hypothetical protein ACI4JZ_00750 [Oscillospiraceae bacterium]
MSEIKREFFKLYRMSTILEWVWAAVMTAGLFLTARGNEYLLTIAIIVSSIVVLYALVITILTLTAPFCFGQQLKKLPENEQSEIQNGKFTQIGKRRFYEHFTVFFAARQIKLVNYSEIKSLEPKGNKLRLVLGNEKKVNLPVEPEENSAMLAAALKSKNPEIAVIINGKVVERTDNLVGSEKTEEKEETK